MRAPDLSPEAAALLREMWNTPRPPKPVPVPFASMDTYHEWQLWTLEVLGGGDLRTMQVWPYRPTVLEMDAADA